MLMCRSERMRGWEYSLVCFTVLSWVCLVLMGILLFVPLTSSVLGSAGTDDINWVSAVYFPGQGDLSYLLSGQGGEVWSICPPVASVRADKVLRFASWLEVAQTVWPCLVFLSQFSHSPRPGISRASYHPVWLTELLIGFTDFSLSFVHFQSYWSLLWSLLFPFFWYILGFIRYSSSGFLRCKLKLLIWDIWFFVFFFFNRITIKILFIYFFNFYCYSITVVCLFSPSLHPTPVFFLTFSAIHFPYALLWRHPTHSNVLSLSLFS